MVEPIGGDFPAEPVHPRGTDRRRADWMEQRFEPPRDASAGD
jgi:hypothetical protein